MNRKQEAVKKGATPKGKLAKTMKANTPKSGGQPKTPLSGKKKTPPSKVVKAVKTPISEKKKKPIAKPESSGSDEENELLATKVSEDVDMKEESSNEEDWADEVEEENGKEEDSDEDEENGQEEQSEDGEDGVEGEEDSEDDDAEEEDSEEDDDEDEDEQSDVENQPGEKRKAKKQSKEPVEKKAKVVETCSISVRGLPDDATKEDIIEHFSTHGVQLSSVYKHTITTVDEKVTHHSTEADLADASTLQTALALNSSEWKGQKINVANKKPNQGNINSDAIPSLYVGNLPENVTEESLSEIFSNAKEIRIPKFPNGNPKNFAFIQFEKMEEVQEALDEHQGLEMNGKILKLDNSTKTQRKRFEEGGGQGGKSKTLFIKNLSYDVDGDALREAFEGAIGARVAQNADSGTSRGFGYVDFETAEEAEAAHKSMQGETLNGRDILIDFAYSKDIRGGRGGGRGGFRGRGGRGDGRGFRGGGRGFRGGGSRGFRGGRGRGRRV